MIQVLHGPGKHLSLTFNCNVIVFLQTMIADECGIVAQVASPLAQADIYSYYICTFSTDHTLVSELA